MTVSVEFFYDLSSPYTHMAFHRIQPILTGKDVSVAWRPFLVGGVFNAVNQTVYESRANMDHPKFKHAFVALKDWALEAGVPMNFPSPHHPVKSVAAMRFCCALEDRQEDLFRFSGAAFNAYFGDQRNLDDPAVLVEIADEIGLDGAALAAAAQTEEVKATLRRNTEEVIERGGYGSPTIFVDREHMYFGNDQLPLVEWRIAKLLSAD